MTAGERCCVHVFATFGAGGPQIRALQLMQRMGPAWRHVIVAMDGRTEAHAQLPPGVVAELAPPPPKGGLLATVRAMTRWLRARAPDLVLTYNWGAIESAAAARRLRLPLVHHEDGFLPDEAARRKRRRSWLRRLVLRAVPVVVPSLGLHRIATDEWRLPHTNVHHFANGVDLARFRPVAANARAAAATTLGTVGGLRPEKDHDTLLRALAELPPAVRAVVVGGGALADALRAAAALLGVTQRVEFAGPVTDTAPWYHRFGLFVLSSRTEQMPIALLEAMASGLPVVATDVGDVRAMLPADAGDLIVPTADPAALAGAIARVLADPARAASLGAANRRTVEERYEADRCLARFVALYEQAAAHRR